MSTRENRTLRWLARTALMTCIFLGAVLLIPAAPGQTGGTAVPGASAPAAPSATAATHALPWRPFIDPIDLHDHWYWLLIPMAFGVSVVYKAVRMQELQRYWLHVLFMTVQIVVALILLGLATHIVAMRFAPWIAAH